MFATGCVVSMRSKDKEATGSGIIFDTVNGLVLTQGTLVSSILPRKQINALAAGHNLQNCFDMLNVYILLQELNHGSKLDRYQSSEMNSSGTFENSRPKFKEDLSYSEYSADVISIFRLTKLEKVLASLMPRGTWEYVEDFSKQEDIDDDEQSKFNTLLSCFILIKLHHWEGFVSDLPLLKYNQLEKGDNLEVVGTPFGGLKPHIFLNSLSRGIVSNKAGNVLLMTDARCVPGTEGGPVFCYKGGCRYLVAMVIATLCWRSNEWVGLSMACCISDLLSSVKQFAKISSIRELNIAKVFRNNFSSLISSVPMVIVGSNWGSGVVIQSSDTGPSFLLTCSHVVKESGYSTVKVKFSENLKSVRGTVIYKTPRDQQFDIAVMSVESRTSSLPISSRKVSLGDKVYVIGHAVFGEDKNLEPTVTSGVISQVITVDNIPVMIQTTCAIHAGASGGAVVNIHGELVGIPVSNAKDTVSKASYPHVNMCVPMVTILPTIQQYLLTKDPSVLENLLVRNKKVQRLWTLDNVLTASKL